MANSSSGGWIQFVAVSSPGSWIQVTTASSSSGWIQVTADLSSGSWIRVAADSILQLNRVPAAGWELRLSHVPANGYKLRLTPPYRWLWFRQLNTSCHWFHPPVDFSSGGWIRVTVDSVLRLTRVPSARYELQVTLSDGWLEFRRLDMSYSWLHPTTDLSSGGLIRLTVDSSCGWLRVVADSILRPTRVRPDGLEIRLAYTLIYQVNLKTYSAKYIFFFVLYHLISVTTDSGSALNLEATWRSLKKLEEASRL